MLKAPKERINVITDPAIIPGRVRGNNIYRKTCQGFAPDTAAASSTLLSMDSIADSEVRQV